MAASEDSVCKGPVVGRSLVRVNTEIKNKFHVFKRRDSVA